jgi:hypothetical protein
VASLVCQRDRLINQIPVFSSLRHLTGYYTAAKTLAEKRNAVILEGRDI